MALKGPRISNQNFAHMRISNNLIGPAVMSVVQAAFYMAAFTGCILRGSAEKIRRLLINNKYSFFRQESIFRICDLKLIS